MVRRSHPLQYFRLARHSRVRSFSILFGAFPVRFREQYVVPPAGGGAVTGLPARFSEHHALLPLCIDPFRFLAVPELGRFYPDPVTRPVYVCHAPKVLPVCRQFHEVQGFLGRRRSRTLLALGYRFACDPVAHQAGRLLLPAALMVQSRRYEECLEMLLTAQGLRRRDLEVRSLRVPTAEYHCVERGFVLRGDGPVSHSPQGLRGRHPVPSTD